MVTFRLHFYLGEETDVYSTKSGEYSRCRSDTRLVLGRNLEVRNAQWQGVFLLSSWFQFFTLHRPGHFHQMSSLQHFKLFQYNLPFIAWPCGMNSWCAIYCVEKTDEHFSWLSCSPVVLSSVIEMKGVSVLTTAKSSLDCVNKLNSHCWWWSSTWRMAHQWQTDRDLERPWKISAQCPFCSLQTGDTMHLQFLYNRPTALAMLCIVPQWSSCTSKSIFLTGFLDRLLFLKCHC